MLAVVLRTPYGVVRELAANRLRGADALLERCVAFGAAAREAQRGRRCARENLGGSCLRGAARRALAVEELHTRRGAANPPLRGCDRRCRAEFPLLLLHALERALRYASASTCNYGCFSF